VGSAGFAALYPPYCSLPIKFIWTTYWFSIQGN
jgi:hypothetical protein